MSNKPKIYAFCGAGCKWEAVHKSDFEKSASHIVQTADANGRFDFAIGKEYKVVTEKRNNGDGTYTFGTIKFTEDNEEYATESVEVITEDKYAGHFVFRLCGFETVNSFLHIVYEIAGVRYDHTVECPLDYVCVHMIDKNANFFLYNADASIRAETPYIGANGNWWVGNEDTGVHAGDSDGATLPTVAASDNGKFLRVVNGVWTAVSVESAEDASF